MAADQNETRKFLQENRESLVEKLEHVELVVNNLGCISNNTREIILAENIRHEQIRRLLDDLNRIGEDACKSFLALLHNTDQQGLCQGLTENLKADVMQMAEEMGDILPHKVYKKKLQSHDKAIIEKAVKMEEMQFMNVVDIAKHPPVIINTGKVKPERDQRENLFKFNAGHERCKSIKLENIFEPDEEMESPRSVLMTAGPGMGKSSSCLQILNLYHSNAWNVSDYIFYIPLRTLQRMQAPTTLATYLLHYHGPYIEDSNALWKLLERRQDRILIMLDGLDEINEEFSEHLPSVNSSSTEAVPITLINSLITGSLWPECKLLMTSRPYKLETSHLNVDRYMTLIGLEMNLVNELVDTVLAARPDVAETLRAQLKQNQDLASFMRIPIYSQKILSYFKWMMEHYSDKETVINLPRTKSPIFTLAMEPTIQQCMRKCLLQSPPGYTIWQNDAFLQLFRKVITLSGRAMETYEGRQILFDVPSLRDCGLSEKEARDSGLFVCVEEPARRQFGVQADVYYTLGHLIRLEWAASFYHLKSSVEKNHTADYNEQWIAGQHVPVHDWDIGGSAGTGHLETLARIHKETMSAETESYDVDFDQQ